MLFPAPAARSAGWGSQSLKIPHEQAEGPEIPHSRQGAEKSLVRQGAFTCRGFFKAPQPVLEQRDGALREMLVAKLTQRIHKGTAALKLTAGWALQRMLTSWILLSEYPPKFFFFCTLQREVELEKAVYKNQFLEPRNKLWVITHIFVLQ